MYFLRFISAGQAATSNTFAFAGFVLARCTCMQMCVHVSFATLETGRNLGQKLSRSGLWGRYWGQNKRRDATIPQATARCDSPQISSELVFLSGEFRRSFHPPVSRGIPHLVVIIIIIFFFL